MIGAEGGCGQSLGIEEIAFRAVCPAIADCHRVWNMRIGNNDAIIPGTAGQNLLRGPGLIAVYPRGAGPPALTPQPGDIPHQREDAEDWSAEPGQFRILVGRSSDKIEPLTQPDARSWSCGSTSSIS